MTQLPKVFGTVDPTAIIEALNRRPGDAVPIRNRLMLNREYTDALFGRSGSVAREGARELWDALNTADASLSER